ncbi:MAG: CHAT domain-containing protein [Desulfobacteraceae bacterium]|nr:CHAT domain-containing protein [Desulfobacteraceae bacterium]
MEQEAPGRVEAEFLRPATLDNLMTRLEDKSKPLIDIIHFDGHGEFDKEKSEGYLLFTRPGSWTVHRVPSKGLGIIMGDANIPLVILSACQSAAIGEGEEPMGSVAVQLTHAGVPSVIAMTHSVLAETLLRYPERAERQRGRERVTLNLYDWFLPALYQAGKDTPLLKDIEIETPAEVHWGNLPSIQKAGFFGRSRELWEIECAFAQGMRRFTVSGFGGQGKTYLAIETGAWLYRTGMFQKVCFVDYAAFQGVDAVALAVATLATVLNKSLSDTDAAEEALWEMPTLLILDNLEAIPAEPLQDLLDVAKRWSEASECRVLLTTRTHDLAHPDYAAENHSYLLLNGLGEEDALAYFQSLLKLSETPPVDPPKRDELLKLFKQVDFHPLSIGLLAKQLEDLNADGLGERLEKLIAETPDNPLLASLNLSLERLDDRDRHWLPRLGVFQGGAMEDVLLLVTDLGEERAVATGRQLLEAKRSGDPIAIARAVGVNFEDGQLPEDEELIEKLCKDIDKLGEMLGNISQRKLAEGADEYTWPTLRQHLEDAGLIRPEYLFGDTYLKFHPMLAPALWSHLSTDEQEQLLVRHWQNYYG